MLDAAGVVTSGLRGELRVRGLIAVWLWAVRAWERDESADMSGTMAALDFALRRAEQAAAWIGGGTQPSPGAEQTEADTGPVAGTEPTS